MITKRRMFQAGLALTAALFIWACTPKVTTDVAAPPAEEKPSGNDETLVGMAEGKPDWAKVDVPMDESVRTGTLPNGMKYYIQKNAKPENRAELRLALNAGAMQEDEDQLGLAHFTEHMCFNGTTNFKKSELVDFLESVGTKFGPDLNAYTSFDETVYMLQVRTDDQELFDKGMLVLSDWASEVTFEGEEIDKERGVVMGEWRSGLGAQERMRDKWFPLIFKDSRYAERLPIGKPEILQNAPYDAFTRFYNDWYRPDLMALVVVGDVDVDAVEKQIKEQFAGKTNPENPRAKKEYEVPNHKETLVAIATDKEASNTQVQIFYKHPAMEKGSMGSYRKSMVHSLYNRMLSTRMEELTQSANPPFLYGFSSYTNFIRTKDFYYSAAGVEPNGVLKGMEALLIENERVLQHGFTATELERAKKAMLNNVEKQYKEADKTQSRRLAMRYVSNFLEGTPTPSPKQTMDLYNKWVPTITIQEVNGLAKNWITDENRVIVVTGPEKEGITLPTEAEIMATIEKMKGVEVKAYVDKVSDEPLLATPLKPTAPKEVKELEGIGVTEMTLANGIKVILKPTDFKNDEILMNAYSPGGHSLIEDARYMSASQTTPIIGQSGVGKFSQIELGKMLAGQTVSVTPFISELEEGFNGSCSPDDFETMLQLVYLYFTEPRQDEDAMNAYMTQMKTQMSFMGANPQFYFFDKMFTSLSQNHPRRQILPKVEDLEKVNLDEVMSIYKDRFADAGDFTFVFTGNFDTKAAGLKIAQYLGNLPTTGRKETWKDVNAPTAPGKIVETFKKGQAPKAFAGIVFSGDFDWDDAQARYDFQSMISVLSIKLREKLREDEGGVYGVQVQGSVERWPNEEYSVLIFFNADPAEVEKLVEFTKEEIKAVMDAPTAEKEITKVTETQRQERIKNLKENRFWSGYLSRAYKNDLDPTKIGMEHYEKYVDALNGDAVQAMAKKIFNFDEIKQFILLPEDKAEGDE